MVKCPNCGATISEYEQGEFCPYCGTKLSSTGGGEQGPQQPEQGYQYYNKGLSISDSLSKGFNVLIKNIGPVLVYWLIPILLIILLSFVQQWNAASLADISAETGDVGEIWSTLIDTLIITIPLSLASFVIQLLFAGGLVGMAKEAYETGRTTPQTGYNIIKKHPLGIIGASIIIAIVVSFGLVLCIIPGVIFCYWWLFTIPIIVIEGRSISDALSSSKNFAKTNNTLVFTIILVVVIIIMNLVGGGIANLIAWGIEGEIFSLSPAIVITPIIEGVITLFVMSFAIISITIHYLKGRPMSAKEFSYGRDDKPPAPPVKEWNR